MIVLARTIILYVLVVAALRVMGKRQIGELQPSELVVAIMISDLAAVPMQSTSIPLVHGIIPMLTLVVLEVTFSFITLKNNKIRKFITGKPCIIVDNGKINYSEMEKLRFNIDDLVEEIRANNLLNVKDVQYAILETNGKLSVFPFPNKNSPSADDLNIAVQPEGWTEIIIKDGEINKNALSQIGKDERWLNDELKKQKIESIDKVLVASYSEKDKLFVQIKE